MDSSTSHSNRRGGERDEERKYKDRSSGQGREGEHHRHHRSEGERRRTDHSSRHRSRSRSPSRSHHRRRHRSPESVSGSASDSDSEEAKRSRRRKERQKREGEGEDSDYERRRRRRREEEREERDSDYERRRRRKRRETSEERTERRQRKKDKKQARRAKGGAIVEYGKHGIISETDVTSRLTAEFRQWLVEERHINPETISRAIEKKEMSSFIEDYNTATMPSDKYYNLDAHERRMALIRGGETVEQAMGYDPLADEAAAKASFKAQRRVAEESSRSGSTQWQSKEQLENLRRVQMERVEAAKMKQMGMQTSANMGVRMDGTEFDRR